MPASISTLCLPSSAPIPQRTLKHTRAPNVISTLSLPPATGPWRGELWSKVSLLSTYTDERQAPAAPLTPGKLRERGSSTSHLPGMWVQCFWEPGWEMPGGDITCTLVGTGQLLEPSEGIMRASVQRQGMGPKVPQQGSTTKMGSGAVSEGAYPGPPVNRGG